jgi:hypothetical protein
MVVVVHDDFDMIQEIPSCDVGVESLGLLRM